MLRKTNHSSALFWTLNVWSRVSGASFRYCMWRKNQYIWFFCALRLWSRTSIGYMYWTLASALGCAPSYASSRAVTLSESSRHNVLDRSLFISRTFLPAVFNLDSALAARCFVNSARNCKFVLKKTQVPPYRHACGRFARQEPVEVFEIHKDCEARVAQSTFEAEEEP